MHTAEWVPVPDPFVDLSDAGGPPADTGPMPGVSGVAWSAAKDVRPPDSSDEEEGPDCTYRLTIAAEARALQAARGCGVVGAYYLLQRRERRKRKKLMESWRRAKWWRYWLRKGRVRHVHVHARHVVRARREEHEESALTIADIFGTDSEDEV